MLKKYIARLVKYQSQTVHCYLLNDYGVWKKIGVKQAIRLRNIGHEVEFEEVTERQHRKEINEGKK